MSGKPVLALSASVRSVHASAQLAEILRTMDARVLGTVLIELPRPVGDALDGPEVAAALREVWRDLQRAMDETGPR